MKSVFLTAALALSSAAFAANKHVNITCQAPSSILKLDVSRLRSGEVVINSVELNGQDVTDGMEEIMGAEDIPTDLRLHDQHSLVQVKGLSDKMLLGGSAIPAGIAINGHAEEMICR